MSWHDPIVQVLGIFTLSGLSHSTKQAVINSSPRGHPGIPSGDQGVDRL